MKHIYFQRRSIFFLLLQLCIYEGFSQQGTSVQDIPLSDLRAPSSPAFIILGVQPNEISRPKSYKALEASVFSSFAEGNQFVLPNNYALEFSPYWFSSHPKLSFEDYTQPTPEQAFIQNLSFSLATSQITNKKDTSLVNTRTSFGFRTQIFSGKATKKNKEFISKAKILSNYQRAFLAIDVPIQRLKADRTIDDLTKFKAALTDEYTKIETQYANEQDLLTSMQLLKEQEVDPFLEGKTTSNKDELNKIINELLENLKNTFDAGDEKGILNTRRIAKNIQDANKENIGFVLEIAGAMVLDFPINTVEYSKVSKWAFWVTPTYKHKNQLLDFIGVLRYLRNDIIDENDTANLFTDNIDLGGRIVYHKDRISLSIEALKRYQSLVLSREEIDEFTSTTSRRSFQDYRATLSIDYKISNNLSLSYTFGRNFQKNTEFIGNVISIVSLNFGIGGPKVESIEGIK